MKSIIRTLSVLVILLLGSSCYAQLESQNFESIEVFLKENPKPIVVFIHTDWCMYCKSMEKTSFSDKEVINKLNTDFYFISLNAETKEIIQFRNRDFKFIPNGRNTGMHQLALELGTIDGKIAYPTITILNPDYEVIFQHASFLNTKQLNRILKKVTKT